MSKRLLPESMYPEDFTEEQFERVDARMRELLPTIPTEPGLYLDREGAEWVRHEDGSWTDASGENRGAAAVNLLGIFGPWTHVRHDLVLHY